MATLTGYARIEVEVDVDDGLDDLAKEEAFNFAVEEAWNRGDLADYDYSVEEEE